MVSYRIRLGIIKHAVVSIYNTNPHVWQQNYTIINN